MGQLLIIWSAVCSLLHPRATKGAKPHLYIFELNCPTPVCRHLSLTQADLASLVPSGVKETSVIYVWSLVILSFRSLFHAWSNQSATPMLKSLLVFSRSCAADTNGCLNLSQVAVSVWDGASVGALRHGKQGLDLLLSGHTLDPGHRGKIFGKKKARAEFVDLILAYDTVWHHRLTCKLLRLLPDRHMTNMIMELVRNRSFTFTTGMVQKTGYVTLRTACPRDLFLLLFYSTSTPKIYLTQSPKSMPMQMTWQMQPIVCRKRLECWRYALERRGMKVSRSKTKYLCINGGKDETVKMKETKEP